MAASVSIRVPAECDGMRLDAFLAHAGCYESRSSAARHIQDGTVLVNAKEAIKRQEVRSGDFVIYEQEEAAKHMLLEGEDIPLDIRYEDDVLMVISKQPGLCVHPSEGHEGSTLVNALIHHYGRDNLAHIQGDDRPGIVHRLDMDTSGLMMCAKDDKVALQLQEQIRERLVDRRYLALVHGNIAHNTGQIDMPLARDNRERPRMRVMDVPSARPAEPTFSVLERFEAGKRDDGYTLLECKLYTGRTHQIRAHMDYIRHCCVGDPLYSMGSEAAQMGLSRQFLHSYSLKFTHPLTGEELAFLDALPADLQSVIDGLEERSMGRTNDGEHILGMLEGAPRQPAWDEHAQQAPGALPLDSLGEQQ